MPRGLGTAHRVGIRLLVVSTAIVAVPFILLGVQALIREDLDPLLPLALFLATVGLSLRPIKILPDAELSPSDVTLLAAIVVLPAAAVVPIAATARLAVDLIRGKRPEQIVRNAGTVAVDTGIASLVYALLLERGAGSMGLTASIPAAAGAVLALVFVDLAQLYLLLTVLGAPMAHRGVRWFIRTSRAQLLWGFAAIIAIEIVRIEPWFLVPALPLFVLGYVDIRARFVAERRARLLATLVEVSHAVGMSLDPILVFRAVYEQVRGVLECDAFFVGIVDQRRRVMSYRYLVEGSRESPPVEIPLADTLGGICVDRNEPILLRDVEREMGRYGLVRNAWGTVSERSIMVAPLRIRGEVIGAISVQSVKLRAYDEGDLELLGAIANEAAIATERADLHERTTALSRRLFDLHRIGVQLSSQRTLPELAKLVADSVVSTIGARLAAVYLDRGGESLDHIESSGDSASGQRTISRSPSIVAALSDGRAVEVPDAARAPETMRAQLAERAIGALFLQPLRAAGESIGILFITWPDPHEFTDDERELIGVVAGMGAAAIRSMRLYLELDAAYLATVSTLTAMIQARDGYREDHQRRIAADAVALGERLELGEDSLRDLRYAALFHSLGKIAVPTMILSKGGPLTPEERRVVQEHPILGARILESIAFLKGVVPIVRHANERWDGSGYPAGQRGTDIALEARILQVAIGYEAMLAERPYRRALGPEAAVAELRALSGVWYDPAVVREFTLMVEARGAIAAAEVEVGAAARELSVLAEITPEFHTLLDMQQLLARILGILERHLPGSSLTIMLRDDASGDLIVRAGAGQLTMGPGRLPSGRGISGWAIEHRESVIVDDVRSDPRYLGDPAIRSEMVVPLLSSARAIGVLVVSHPSVAIFGQRDLTLLQAVAAQIAAAIDVADLHERLKRAASTDALTGIHNYGYFYDRLEEEVARAERHGQPLAVAYFDIDELKKVNDTYGHLAGDAVLRTLGTVIGNRVRTEDIPARYGGDEFAIVMPETPRETAELVVGRLMEELDATPVELPDGSMLQMPARSWGIASYPLDGKTAKALVENADTRAYALKRARSS
ncbi:MAG: hypothetical protein NVS1B1_04660 [Candidatus Limnocylindrales bacterium]